MGALISLLNGPPSLSGGMAGARNRVAPANAEWIPTYEGLQGPGLPNLTQRIAPPQPPQPEEQQGVGRGPGEHWEHQVHPIGLVPPSWYFLETPYLYDVPMHGDLIVGTDTPPDIQLALNYYENWVASQRHAPIGGGAASTVPNPGAPSQTVRRLLPTHTPIPNVPITAGGPR
jgi:hypothetical protein